MAVRTNSEGLLEILHPETGAYVPASALLQVEGGLLSSLVPDQVALLTSIRDTSAYLISIESVLTDLRVELLSIGNHVSNANEILTSLTQIDATLTTVKGVIDALESLGAATNVLLATMQSEIALLSGKVPATLGAKVRTESLSVALATDSTIFTSLSNLLAALSDGGSNSTLSYLSAVSGKLPASLGAKINTNSLSVALATDSAIFTSLTNILSALSDGGVNSALSYLNTISDAQFWKTPTKLNTTSPIINAATGAMSSEAHTINAHSEALSLQNFFSATGLSAQFAVELRLTAGSTSLHDRTYYYRGDVATPFSVSTGVYPGESPIVIPTYGYVQAVVHLQAISGDGNITTYAREIR